MYYNIKGILCILISIIIKELVIDFKEELRILKIHYKVFTNKDLAKKIGISEAAIKKWNNRKEIPKRYTNIIEEKNIKNSGDNNIIVGANNNGTIHINSVDEMEKKLCEIIKELSTRRKEYYFYKISAELLEND